jgi:hypothetical protein
MAAKPTLDENDALICPTCGEPCLHHEVVALFVRPREDAPTEARALGAGGVGTLAPDLAERLNPSPRRGAVAVRFACENCCASSELLLVQHKGVTHVSWRPAGSSSKLFDG